MLKVGEVGSEDGTIMVERRRPKLSDYEDRTNEHYDVELEVTEAWSREPYGDRVVGVRMQETEFGVVVEMP